MKPRTILGRLIPRQINPIVIKELRQAVRSRLVSGILLLFLATELFGIGIILLSSTKHATIINYYTGRNTFHFLYIALSTACLLFIPTYAGVRLAMERWDNNLDLLYITTIKPRAVIRGKLLAAMAIALLLFSAAAPFMSFSYLLRGIDLPSIFIAMAFVFIYVAGITQVAIFLACMPTSRPFKVILGLMSIAGLFWSLILVNIAGWEMIQSGVGNILHDPDTIITAASIIVGVTLTIGMLQRMSVALISPPSANRSLPVRRYATLMWAVSGLGVFGISNYYYDGEIMMAWMIPSIIITSTALIWGLSENTALSSRVRHSIPHNPILRRLAFLFYNGPVGAMFWSFWMALLTFVFSYIGIVFIDQSFDKDLSTLSLAFLSFFMYAIAYGLTAVLLWRKLLYRRMRYSTIGVIAGILMVIGALLPSLFALLLRTNATTWGVAWYIGNIFTVASKHHINNHLIFSAIWATLAVALNGRWIYTQIKNFVPLQISSQKDPESQKASSQPPIETLPPEQE